MTLNEFAKQVHENAVAHGWWDNERPINEIIALIHSEWSEALEEYRAGRDLIWYAEDGKPEGIAVELIDGVIRILDYLVHENVPVIGATMEMRNIKPDDKIDWPDMTVTSLIAILHFYTSYAWLLRKDDCFYSTLYKCILIVFVWFKKHDLDVEEIALKKHEYNKTRPYKHGKVC